MNSSGFGRFYDRFTPRERLNLVLDAMTRGDNDEVRRLGESCPRKTYVMGDMQHTELLDASRAAAVVFTLSWQPSYHACHRSMMNFRLQRLVLGGILVGYIWGANAVWNAAGKKGRLYSLDRRASLRQVAQMTGKKKALDRLEKALEAPIRKAVSELKGLYQGLQRFCQRAGMEPGKFLAWYPPVLGQIEEVWDLINAEDVPMDEEWASDT